jgi:hypothetical protein
MPFDGTMLKTSFVDVLRDAGINPIPNEVWIAHKRAQIKLHPGSWAYQHRNFLREMIALSGMASVFGMALGALGMIISGFSLCFGGHDPFGVYSLIAAVAVIGVSFVAAYAMSTAMDIKLKQPAEWKEHVLTRWGLQRNDWFNAPEPVQALMNKVASLDPSLQYAYGELIQGYELLDPYFYVLDPNTNKKIVLAIWDGDTVLHLA